jgi:hypothetical protein
MSAPSSIQLKRPALSAENGDAGMVLLLVATLAPRVVRHRLRARLGRRCSSAVHDRIAFLAVKARNAVCDLQFYQ